MKNYDLRKRSDMKRFVKDLKNEVANIFLDQLMNYECPSCGYRFDAELGENICPNCSETITIRFGD